jgi:hypothetical protein
VVPGSYSVSASSPGYFPQSQTVGVGPGETTTQNFVLGRDQGTITGTVTDAVTGQPVAGAAVSYTNGSARTDAGGQYTLAQVPAGQLTLSTSATGYDSQSQTVTVTPDSSTTQDFALSPQPGSINGKVTDSSSGQPIVGASVSYSGGTAITDASGSFGLSGVSEGSYTVTAAANGYASQGQTVVVGPGAAVNQNLALAPLPGTFTGTVKNGDTGLPVAGATISTNAGSAVSDGGGSYSLTVPPGTYSLTVSAAGYTSATVTSSVDRGATTNLDQWLFAPLLNDGFESGSMSGWTSVGVGVQSTTVRSGTYAAEAGSSSGAASYARKTLPSVRSNLYYRVYFRASRIPSSTATIMGDRTAGGGSVARLYMDTQGRLALRNDVGGTSTVGPTVGAGAWHSLEMHVTVNGTASTVEVWLDGNRVQAFTTTTANLGTTGVGAVQIGENQTGRNFDFAIDDVVVQGGRIGG